MGRRTVEEIILARAASKLKFTNTILYEKSDEVGKYNFFCQLLLAATRFYFSQSAERIRNKRNAYVRSE